jgi:hypothetical protein
MRFTGDSDTRSGYTYVGEWWAQAVSAYPTTNRRNRGPVCQTQEVRFAEGMTVDRSGTLYVAGHLLRSAGVATFGPNCGGAGASFVDPTDSPQDPVVDGATLYLTTIDDGSQAASIFVYNLTTGPEPMRQLTDPNAGLGIGVAVDSHHDLFWATNNPWSLGGQVIEFRRGQMPGTLLKATSIGSDYPGGVLVDRSNNLLFIDQSRAAIYIYARPYDAAPFSTISLKGYAEYCALGVNQTRIYCMDEAYASVDAYTYPKGTYLYSYTNGIDGKQGPGGIAIAAPSSGSSR